MDSLTLLWYDYLIFILVLLFSISIGIYFGFFAKNNQSDPSEYLQGKKQMSPLPVAVSLTASSTSVSILLSYSSEAYSFGANTFLLIFGMIIAYCANKFIYLPVFYSLEIDTVYEYLEKRFDKRARQLASSIFTICCVCFMSMTIYTPALALSAVTGFKLQYIIVGVSCVCIFYTSVGGFKTVIWTDVLQFFVVLASLLTTLGLAVGSSGGFRQMWHKAVTSGRLDIFEFDPNPTRHSSVWIIVIGYSFTFMSITCVDQIFVQKTRSIRNIESASKALIFFTVGHYFIVVVCILLGLAMYAKYWNCDPVSANFIQKPDQLLPYLVMDVGNQIPGVSGIFVSAIFSSSLSLQSAILNCLSGSIYSDFLKPFVGEIPESRILKLTVLGLGVLCTVLAFVIQYLGTLFHIIFTIVGATGGPILGMFTCGLLVPRINSKGAFYGTLSGFVICLSIALPATYYQAQSGQNQYLKPISTSCLNQTLRNETTTDQSKSPWLFQISYFYYSVIGTIVTAIVAFFVSCMTQKKNFHVDKNLISPIARFLVEKAPENSGRSPTLNGYLSIGDAFSGGVATWAPAPRGRRDVGSNVGGDMRVEKETFTTEKYVQWV
ncbi:Putative sodium-dependent multivitamin transporter-like Protein [Tribolium castaneum]|uniref:Sodium-dependent multivitamin transporter-like Protein n=1 Tax=Tribolium castaneum TaxID=7070 RepID=A0A139WE90_TRICA|nr:Putative sodium-dependent multivitamin transporter-like Protein [Tribolium castaneum]